MIGPPVIAAIAAVFGLVSVAWAVLGGVSALLVLAGFFATLYGGAYASAVPRAGPDRLWP